MDTSVLQKKSNLAAVVIVLGLLGTVGVAALLGASSSELGLAVVGGLVTAGIVIGTYQIGRGYGHPHSHAVAEATVALGSLYFISLAYWLLTEFGVRPTSEVTIGIGAAVGGAVLIVAITAFLARIGPSPN